MPIRPEQRDAYPADWKQISDRIRFERAGGRCECTGECGRHPRHLAADGRCTAKHGDPLPSGRWTVILTTAHLDHDPGHSTDDNLKALCQACHLAYDADHHAETRRARAAASPGDPMLW